MYIYKAAKHVTETEEAVSVISSFGHLIVKNPYHFVI